MEHRGVLRGESSLYFGAAARAHLSPRLRQDIDDLVVWVFGGEAGGFVLDERQAQGVLEPLHLGILSQVLLAVELLHAMDEGRLVAERLQDLGGFAGVKAGASLAPSQVAHTA